MYNRFRLRFRKYPWTMCFTIINHNHLMDNISAFWNYIICITDVIRWFVTFWALSSYLLSQLFVSKNIQPSDTMNFKEPAHTQKTCLNSHLCAWIIIHNRTECVIYFFYMNSSKCLHNLCNTLRFDLPDNSNNMRASFTHMHS